MGAFRFAQLWWLRAADHPTDGSGLPGTRQHTVAMGNPRVGLDSRLRTGGRAAASRGRGSVRWVLALASRLSFWHWLLIATIAGPWVLMLGLRYLMFVANVVGISGLDLTLPRSAP